MRNLKKDNTINLISKTRKISSQFILNEMAKINLDGLVPSHGDIILLLLSKEEVTMTEIAQAISKERSTVTSLIDKLKKYGYVQTKKSPQCGRTTLVYLTDKGKKLEEAFIEISNLLNTTYRVGISDEELTICRAVLTKICSNLSID